MKQIMDNLESIQRLKDRQRHIENAVGLVMVVAFLALYLCR